jgi:ComF family protein
MPLISENDTCTRCLRTDYFFDSNIAVFAHSGPARQLLARLKFEGRRRVAALFADMIVERMDPRRRELPIVPVPPRPGRARPDGIELVARSLERRHGRVVRRILQRSGGAQQKSLDFVQRRDNLMGKIDLHPAVRSRAESLPRGVLLLDDVFTTGATLDACARALREAGCLSVLAMTLTIEE